MTTNPKPNLKSDNTITTIVMMRDQPKVWQDYYPNSIWWETNLKYDKTITPIVYDGRPGKTPTKKPGHHPAGRVGVSTMMLSFYTFLMLYNV